MHHSEKDKSRAEKWFREGLSLRREGEFRRAIEAFDRAIEADRDFAEAYFEKGVCHYSLKTIKTPVTTWMPPPCSAAPGPRCGAGSKHPGSSMNANDPAGSAVFRSPVMKP